MNDLILKKALESSSFIPDNTATLFAEARSPQTWEKLRAAPQYKDQMEELILEGKRLLSEPVGILPFSAFKLYDTKGTRVEYEAYYFGRRKRLTILATLALLEESTESLQALEDTIWAICEEYSWCLPAHFWGHSLEPFDEHKPPIDLFAAETGFALAEIVSLLKDKLHPLVAERAVSEVKKRILEPYSALDSSYGWETLTNNWAAVCAASVGGAALYLLPDADRLTPVLLRVIRTIEGYLSGFEEDGACTEGVGYWTYGFGFFVSFAELLRQRTANQIDLLADEKVRQIALFHQKCYLSGAFTVPFSDCETVFGYSVGLIHYLKRRYPDVHVPEWKHRLKLTHDPMCRFTPTIRDFVWSDGECGLEWPDATYDLPDAQWLVIRQLSSDGRKLSFAAKGGHNDEPHNHNDIGSFVLHLGGETLLADIGSGEYTKDYFGADRYSLLCNGSHGHSVPIVDGMFQQAGRSYKSTILSTSEEAKHGHFAIDLTQAYAVPHLELLTRSFTLTEDHSDSVILHLHDRFKFSTVLGSLTERFISLYKPVQLADDCINIRGISHSVCLTFDCTLLSASIREFEFINKSSQPTLVYAIDLELIQPSFSGSIELEFKAMLPD
ncbi:MAG: heparinase II/III-family protein [Gorillibacterium sp.]|nr:heparinase II/III-family protein [Gorillibacterium sp.]